VAVCADDAPAGRAYREAMIVRRLLVHREGLRELGIFALAYLVYFGVRAITEGTTAIAMQNAMDLVRLEQRLGVAWERAVQDTVVGSRLLLDAVNAVYMYGHWPVLILAGVLLFRYRRRHYYDLRNACLLSGLVGLVIFAFFPVAPPRLTDLPLVDTVTRHAEGYRQIVPPELVNQYAAMPSFHAGWNVLVGIVVFRATRHWLLRGLAVVGPAAMVVAVVATANHFVVDVVAGVGIVLGGLLILRARDRRTLVRAHDHEHPRAVHRRPPSRQRPGAHARGRGAAAPSRRG
jgi:hypothetical protein